MKKQKHRFIEHETGHLYNAKAPDGKIHELLTKIQQSENVDEIRGLIQALQAREEIGGNLSDLRYSTNKMFALLEILSTTLGNEDSDQPHRSAGKWIVDKMVERILAGRTHLGITLDNSKLSPWDSAVLEIPEIAADRGRFEGIIDDIYAEYQRSDIDLSTEYALNNTIKNPGFITVSPTETALWGGSTVLVGGFAYVVGRNFLRRREVAHTENLVTSLFPADRAGRKQAKDLMERLQLGVQASINTDRRTRAIEELLERTRKSGGATYTDALKLAEKLREH